MSRNPDGGGGFDASDTHDPMETGGAHDPTEQTVDEIGDNTPIDMDERCPQPVTVSADATRLNGVVLVTCRLHNRTTTRRGVRLRDELPGPTLPPRREGLPERGWDDDTYTTVLPPTTTRAVGYASPADGSVSDTPVALLAVGDPAMLVDTDDRVGHARFELADWAPPEDIVRRDIVPDGGTTDETATEADAATTNEETITDEETTTAGTPRSLASGPPVAFDYEGKSRAPFADGAVPTVVTAYLDAAAERIDRAAATADGVQAATDALRDTHHTPVTLEQAVARDEAALRALAERATTLADRAAATNVPVDSLRRLS